MRQSFTPSIEFFRSNIVKADYSVTLTHYIPLLDTYTSKPLSKGNSKLGKNVLIFDIPAIYTCMNCQDCASSCYAMKAQRQYKKTFNKRMVNWYRAIYEANMLRDDIAHQIIHTSSKKPGVPLYVRIHSSGDFFSQEYVKLWTAIAVAVSPLTNVKFYYYTKVDDILDFSHLNNLPNVNMVNSLLPDGRINFAPFEEVFEIAKETGVFVCPYGNPYINEKLHRCGETCTHCMHHKHVLFIKH